MKSVRERQTPSDFTHMRNLRNKGAQGKKKERVGGKPRNRLLTTENKLTVTRGEQGARLGEMGDGISSAPPVRRTWRLELK